MVMLLADNLGIEGRIEMRVSLVDFFSNIYLSYILPRRGLGSVLLIIAVGVRRTVWHWTLTSEVRTRRWR